MSVRSCLPCCQYLVLPPHHPTITLKPSTASETIVFRRCGRKITVIKEENDPKRKRISTSLKLHIEKLKSSVKQLKRARLGSGRNAASIQRNYSPQNRAHNYTVSHLDNEFESPSASNIPTQPLVTSPTAVFARAINSEIIMAPSVSVENSDEVTEEHNEVVVNFVTSRVTGRSRVEVNGRLARLGHHRKKRLRRTDIVRPSITVSKE